jgi:hypothetical protein
MVALAAGVTAIAIGAGSAGAAVEKTYCFDNATTTVSDAVFGGAFRQFLLDAAITTFKGVFIDTKGTHSVAAGACAVVAAAADPPAAVAWPQWRPPERAGYCMNGKFEDLIAGQPAVDPAWQGAVPAYYVEGIGLTCDTPSADYKLVPDVLVDGAGQSLPAPLTGATVISPLYKKITS